MSAHHGLSVEDPRGWLINRSREAEIPKSNGANSDLGVVFWFRTRILSYHLHAPDKVQRPTEDPHQVYVNKLLGRTARAHWSPWGLAKGRREYSPSSAYTGEFMETVPGGCS